MRFRKSLYGIAIVCLLALAVFLLTYYRADGTALAAMESTADVTVEQTAYGWRFDGPGEDAALVFYPGARVQAQSYAPLMRRLAQAGLDACLVRMPLRLAFFAPRAIDRVMAEHTYSRWYLGGHSLGGAIAAARAADSDGIDGLVLCAAYPTKPLDNALTEVLIYGSEDRVLNMRRVEESRQYAPERYVEQVIPGGNHARFGSYGPQRGDGAATISAEQQQDESVRIIMEAISG